MRLDWPGAFNARDLGGPPANGGRTRPGAIVRSDSLQALTAEGWEALLAHGVRTVADLRDDGERGPDASPRPDARRGGLDDASIAALREWFVE